MWVSEVARWARLTELPVSGRVTAPETLLRHAAGQALPRVVCRCVAVRRAQRYTIPYTVHRMALVPTVLSAALRYDCSDRCADTGICTRTAGTGLGSEVRRPRRCARDRPADCRRPVITQTSVVVRTTIPNGGARSVRRAKVAL